jgi:hypothetical protein
MWDERIKIEDDFLPKREFERIAHLLLYSGDFSWYIQDDPSMKGMYHFTHMFYIDMAPNSEYFKEVKPILQKLNSFTFFRIKADLLMKTSNHIESTPHSDLSAVLSNEKHLAQWTTSIFYLNTNNGCTKFEDGTEVESIANRMISFPANMLHTGTTCTNEAVRGLININHFK